MPKRKDPASVVVEYFQSAPIESADTVLEICRGIVAKRHMVREPKPRVVGKPAPVEQAG